MTGVREGLNGHLGALDRGLYALFSRHADEQAHATDRQHYRAAGLETSFDLYIARVYGLAWTVGLLVATQLFVTTLLAPSGLTAAFLDVLGDGVPVLNEVRVPAVPRLYVGAVFGALVGVAGRWLVLRAGRLYLSRRAAARRAEIERTLPGAVRYLRVLASGSNDQREMLQQVAGQDAYGATADAFRRILNKAALTGNLDEGLTTVARDTPSRDVLAPFLLKFREHAGQSRDSLEGYLEMEGRLLSQRQQRAHQRASGYMELLAELFVVMLVFPALAVLILTVASVFTPELNTSVSTPLGAFTYREVLVYAAAVFVLLMGLATALTVAALRPTDHAMPTYQRPTTVGDTLRTAHENPASAAFVCLAPATFTVGVLWSLGYKPIDVALLGYAVYGVPVGAVASRRARLDDAKDREIQDFIHAVSGHVSLGLPFPAAVRRVTEDVDFGPLQPDVEALAFNLGLTTSVDETDDVRAAALDRFVGRVGTPLASQTVGLVVGALSAGSNTEKVFETLETEIGRLYHERKELRSQLMVYVAVGWTTALLVVGVVVAVNATVLDGFSQLSGVAESTSSTSLNPAAIDPAQDRERFYLVTQATVLACGWFAGMASRGKYEALLHSGLLVVITYVVFTGLGVV
ncbi:Archaellum biogenesis protein FlaJ, TadC family [Halovenus aranensis]|jgi:archaellum biogenesis protein FlaJ (TadC family)|uniref:Archaellum biogenesis protein FlaJ, TadC family n=1 Tax=Halovenus aranensis TaxID=890420 RepID=A0A1G8WSP8_9EURY|nr:type II secretion system F family protein [Halovenus aranensis]SDJ80620.1 Archaellum biogenesis protein FlaJ, TadC family [Halovenus aranensis]